MLTGEIIHGFLLKEKRYVKEEESTVHVFEHEKSGARLIYMENDEENKVFCISFATLPSDSTGVAHIIEHSVLCGSEKYPLKDPFVKLMNSSLNTFLNAMTFMDKTMYPVASMNEKDFSNLCSVYSDAVFSPLIRKDDTAFLQEGWHYETDGESLKINGIVYNEMKGVYSDPEEVLSETVGASLFPDTGYAFDSGGDPRVIPSLSYEKYLEFYNSCYSPSNSYIFIYGNTDIDRRLRELDENYLSKCPRTAVPKKNYIQKPFEAPGFVEREYTVQSPEDEEDGCYFARAYAFSCDDVRTVSALNVLVKILFDTDSSPLKKALTDTGIASETVYDMTTCVPQPYFTIAAKNACREDLEVFGATVDRCLGDLAENGIPEDMILASLNNFEFDLRESDSGSYPRGLVCAIRIMDSWLYGKDPFEQLEYEPTLKWLRENSSSAFYQGLIRKHMLDNPHSSTVVLSPRSGLSEERERQLDEELRDAFASMTEDEKAAVRGGQERLRKRQNEPDSAEVIASIPVLSLSEIDPLPRRYEASLRQIGESRLFTHTDRCSGIVYADMGFDIRDLTEDEISMIDLITESLGVYDTLDHTEEELANLTGIYLGDINVAVSLTQDITDPFSYGARLVFSAKALSENAPRLFDICREILTRTVYNDPARLLRTVTEEISKFTYNMLSNAESMAAVRIASAFTPRGYFKELEKGQAYYRKLCEVRSALERGDTSPLDELNSLLGKIVTSSGLDVLVICDEADAPAMETGAEELIRSLPASGHGGVFGLLRAPARSEGIVIPSDVCYTGIGANVASLGMKVPLELAFVRKYLRTSYLWDSIRVKGGAYGAILSTDRGGDVILMSYRDPAVAPTYRVYEEIPKVLRESRLSEKDINDLTIGTISDIDMPLPVYSRGRRVLTELYTKNSWEKQCEVRSALLSVKPSDIAECADVFDAVLEKGLRVSMGSRARIGEASAYFDDIYSIREK